MKVYNTAPDGNQMADLEPARYFNLAIAQIQKAEEWLKTADQSTQDLLVHVDMFVYLSKKYPEMAKRRVLKLDRDQLRSTFEIWFARCEKKIPATFREGIKQSAEHLFAELEQL